YFDMHDFSFYRIQIAQVRYIAGFGKMGWASDSDFKNTNDESQIAEQETAIIDHMNTDHVHSLIAYSKHFHGVDATHAQMLGIDSDGFDAKVETNNQQKILRFNFEQPIHDAESARAALVTMSKASRHE
ncbi:MAG: DUF2470 domain-containing protein, partial [Methylotenera sp.]